MYQKNKPTFLYRDGPGIKYKPLQKLAGLGIGLMLTVSQSVSAQHGPPVYADFDVKQVFIDMEEKSIELPVPNYEMVDVLGAFKNAEGSIACGGTNSEGTAEDADDCLLRPQKTFTNGYMDTNGTVVTPNAAVYNGSIAGVEVHGYVGDILELYVSNKLPADLDDDNIADATGFFAPESNLQSVHWHGMELDNESDGTPITESAILPGDTRLYRYRLYRPGPYWFHPHILPLLTESRGMVGRLIVHNISEDVLRNAGVLPQVYKAFTLSDSTVANEYNQTVFDGGEVFEHFSQFEVDNNLMPNITPDLDGDGMCDRGPGDCIVEEGELVFVNGVVPTSDANIPTLYIREGGGARLAFINSSNERFYRFRLLLDGEEPPPGRAERVNRSTTGECYGDPTPENPDGKFEGADPLSCEQGLPLYRVGGENGLLDHVRLEGQPELASGEPAREFDTVIRTGEDFIGPAERTEFVVVTKDRQGNYLEPGDEMFVWTVDYPHGLFGGTDFDDRGEDVTIGDGRPRNRDIVARKLVRIKIVPNYQWWLPDYDIAENDPLMLHPVINRPTEDIKTAAAVELDATPGGLDPSGNPFAGTQDKNIVLGNRVVDGTRFPALNGERGHYEGVDGIVGDLVPTQTNTRYARVGDVVEFVYANNTFAAHHPFHMHGFSFQPISVHNFENLDLNEDGTDDSVEIDPDPVYTYDYNEYVDVIAMQPGKAVKFRMKMNDRFKIPDAAYLTEYQIKALYPYDLNQFYGGAGDVANPFAEMGGGVGRWLYHCHILHHAGLGMIGDLCVAPENDPDASACKIDIDENITFPTPWWW